MSWLHIAGIADDLSSSYRSRWWNLSKRKREIGSELFAANPPETYQAQLLLDAEASKQYLPLYWDLLNWMESQRVAAQQDPEFVPKWEEAIENTREQIRLLEAEIQDLQAPYNASDHDVDDVLGWAQDTGLENIVPILDEFGIEYFEVEFPKATVLRFDTQDSWVYDNGSLTQAEEWVRDAEPYHYFEFEPDDWFWQNPNPVVYHATPAENVEDIQQNGIEARCETRGISNRSTGCAVFTSESPHDIDAYGEVVFEINVLAMQADGYTPMVTKEEPVEEYEAKMRLAQMLELDDFHWDVDSDMSFTTIIFHDDIPPKYIRVFE